MNTKENPLFSKEEMFLRNLQHSAEVQKTLSKYISTKEEEISKKVLDMHRKQVGLPVTKLLQKQLIFGKFGEWFETRYSFFEINLEKMVRVSFISVLVHAYTSKAGIGHGYSIKDILNFGFLSVDEFIQQIDLQNKNWKEWITIEQYIVEDEGKIVLLFRRPTMK